MYLTLAVSKKNMPVPAARAEEVIDVGGCDSWKDVRAAEEQEASERRLAEMENVIVQGHSLEEIQGIQRYSAYTSITQYYEWKRSFLFRPVTVTVTSDVTFVAEGVTSDNVPVVIEFDTRKTQKYSHNNYVSVATVKQWPEAAAVEPATLESKSE